MTKGTRDPGSPACSKWTQWRGTFKIYTGLPRSGTLSIESIPTDRRERAALWAKFARLAKEAKKPEKKRSPRKRIDLSFPTFLTSLPLLGGLIISHDRPRMRYGPNIGPAVVRQRSVSQAARRHPGRINRRRLRSRVGQRPASWSCWVLSVWAV